jgi:hypothetical protein
VKRFSIDDTGWATNWENRSSPVAIIFNQARVLSTRAFLCLRTKSLLPGL